MAKNRIKFGAVLTAIIFFILTGCVTQKDLEYIQSKDKNIRAYKAADFEDYKLKPSDELYITITSLDEVNANVFSNGGTQQTLTTSSIQPYGASLVAYTINKEGYLLLPVVGSVYVKDKTLSEVSVMLKDSLINVLNQPLVTVKLVNRYVSVLGEVKFPGHFPYSQDKLSIYDALGLAGDMTIYANRQEVVLSRNENGQNIIIRLDLTKPQILESNYYYIRPNDMIYIMPMQKRIWGMSEFPFAIILSALSVTLLFYSVIK
jgi:polysaccharide export outer membrane protein